MKTENNNWQKYILFLCKLNDKIYKIITIFFFFLKAELVIFI